METVKVLIFALALWTAAKVADVLMALGMYEDDPQD